MIGLGSASMGFSVLSLARGEKSSKHSLSLLNTLAGTPLLIRARESTENSPFCLSGALRAQGKTRKRKLGHFDSSKGRP